ncbi:cation:proton antiporter [Candidatus Micrarchaeota archaeon]|nr:cation:proton antiporter [Candidatus Micrarchaeota archaeon]
MALDVSQISVITLGVVALVAILVGLILSRLGFASSVGYILAGVFLGPLGLGLLRPGEGLAELFGQIGLLMLLFYLGLELSIENFKKTGAVALALVFVESVAAFATGFAISKFFGFTDLQAVVIGAMLPFASTAIVVKFMMDKKIFDWPESRIAVSSLVIEDFLAILVLVFLSSLSTAKSLNLLVVNGLLFTVAMFFIVRKISRYALNILDKLGHQDKMALYAIGVGILVGYFGELLGISSALGAYFAGFALAETKYGERIKNELGLFREFFILFFFVSFGVTVTLPSAPILYVLLAALVVAYVFSKMLAYGVFGTALGFKTKAAITTGILMLSIGEFSIIIAAAAAPLIPNGADIISLAFMMTLCTAILMPVLFNYREKVADNFISLYPARVRKLMSVVGVEMKAAQRLSHVFEDAFWSSVKSLLSNFVIALAVVYMGAILNSEILLPAFPNLPSSASLALLILPLVVWPIYRTFQELRFLFTLLVERFAGPSSVEKTAEAFVGLIMVFTGVLVGGWLYGQHVPPLYLLLPGLYTVLAVLFLSRSLWSWFEHAEKVQGLLSERPSTPANLVRMAKNFDVRGELVFRLNEERALAKEQITEALSSGSPAKARHLLSTFRRREGALLEKLDRIGPMHPFKEKPAPRSHLEGYFMGKLNGKDGKSAKKK